MEDGRTAQQLEVDEYGVPRTASGEPDAAGAELGGREGWGCGPGMKRHQQSMRHRLLCTCTRCCEHCMATCTGSAHAWVGAELGPVAWAAAAAGSSRGSTDPTEPPLTPGRDAEAEELYGEGT